MHQGEILKRTIDSQATSNEEIAKRAGIAVSSLYNYYNMEEIPSKKLRLLSSVLGVDYIRTFIQPIKPDATGDSLSDDGKETGITAAMRQMITLLKQQAAQQKEIQKQLAEVLKQVKKNK